MIFRPSEEQARVIESWGRGMAVTAGAGCGKTTTLVQKCVALLERNHEARFAAVSFTERSASDLREKLALKLMEQDPALLSRQWVMTIHGLCGAIIREFPRQAGYDGEESVLDESESQLLWERAISALWFEELPEDVNASLELLLDRESKDSVLGLLARLRELGAFGALESLARSGEERSRALHRLACYVLERFDRLKRRRGAIDFADLERGADRALEHAEVRAAFHRRFELVLVDEFQDTNAVQARIIERFVRPEATNLCIVGDPKQSIYRFRDADVSVFQSFCERLPESHSLTRNFRSRPGIIDFTNQVCAPAFEESELPYEPLVPMREPAEETPVARVNVEKPEDLGRFVLAEIARGVKLEEMVVLMRQVRGGGEKWLKALTGAGIPIAVGSGGFFWKDARVRELTAFLKWWENPGNSYSGAVFLRAPWMGISDEVLDRWIREDRTWLKPFLASGHPVAEALKRLDRRAARPGETLLALLDCETGARIERELGAPLLGLWHRAEELSARGLDFHAVVAEFAAAMEEERRERDVPPPRAQGQLTVLTLHASKGLEFPHVILVDFVGKKRAESAPLLFWDTERGAFLGMRDDEGERDKESESEWRALETRKSLAESKRLFYVALTRARERLVLVFPPCEKVADEPYSEDNWRAWIEASRIALPAPEVPASAANAERASIAPAAKAPALTPIAPRRARHSVTEWNVLRHCPRQYEWTYIRPRLGSYDPREFAQSFQHVDGVSQRELGSRVHACLEHGDFEGLKALESEAGEARFLADPVILWAAKSPWMAPSNPKTGRRVWAEFAFEVPIDGEILVGSIDRLVYDPSADTRYTIIDFKVTRERKSAKDLLEAYEAQLELYAWALQALDSKSRGDTQAVLVNISPGSVDVVEVPLPGVSGGALPRRIGVLVAGARGIAAGPAAPAPSASCRYCEFRSICPESAQNVSTS